MLPFTRFYNPSVEVELGNLKIGNLNDDGLRIAFSVTRTIEPEPDIALVRIHNLAEFRRKQITEAFNTTQKANLILKVGYDQLTKDIFRGDIYRITHIPEEGIDYVTELNSGDGMDAYRDSYMANNIAPGVTLRNLFDIVQTSMKVSAGVDAQKAFNESYNAAKVVLFKNGFVAAGRAADVLDEMTKTLNLKWWIRDGQIQMVPKNQVTTDFAIVLSPQTGLNTYVPEDQDFCQFTCDLNPEIFPGRQVIIQDENGMPQGASVYRVERVEYSGDTHGNTGFIMAGFARNPRILL